MRGFCRLRVHREPIGEADEAPAAPEGAGNGQVYDKS